MRLPRADRFTRIVLAGVGCSDGGRLKFALSLAEQGFGSALTFGVNIWLIRNGAAAAYGTYVFWLSVAFAGGVLEGTIVLAHLSRLPSARDNMAARRDPERFMLSVTIIILSFIAVLVAIGNAVLTQYGSELATPAAVLFIPAFLFFHYVRTFAFSRQRPALAAALTGGILVAALLALAIDFELGNPPEAGRVLLLTGLAFGGVSAAVLLILLDGAGPMVRLSELKANLGYTRGFAWLMMGAGSNEVTSRLYSFVIVGRNGTEALAQMSAVQVVIRPAWLLSSAWTSIGFPEMASRWAKRDMPGLIRTMALGSAMTVGGSLVWSLIVLEGWPWISATLYHGRYAQIGPLALLWGINVVVGSLCVVANTAMLAIGEFRRLALVDLAGAVTTIGGLLLISSQFSYPYSIVATIAGQLMQLALMAWVLNVRIRPPALAAAAPG